MTERELFDAVRQEFYQRVIRPPDPMDGPPASKKQQIINVALAWPFPNDDDVSSRYVQPAAEALVRVVHLMDADPQRLAWFGRTAAPPETETPRYAIWIHPEGTEGFTPEQLKKFTEFAEAGA